MFQNIKKSYFKKIFVLALLSNLCILLLTGTVFGFMFYKRYDADIKKQVKTTVQNIQNALEETVKEYTDSIESLSREKYIIDYFLQNDSEHLETKIAQKLYFIKNNSTQKAEISVINTVKKHWISTDIKSNKETVFENTNWGIFRKANAVQGVTVYAFAKESMLTDSDRICMAKAYRNPNEISGYILAEISRPVLYHIITDNVTVYNTDVMIVNANGSVIFHSGGPLYEGLGKLKNYGLAGIVKNMSDGVRIQNGYLCSFSEKLNLYVVQGFPSNALKMTFFAIQRTFWVILIFIFFLAFVSSWTITRTIVRPIKELEKTISRLGRGDFSARVLVDREDEIGKLGEAFNAMAKRIEKLLINIDEKKHSLWVAETRSLNLQITPHFLYNTLDLIKWNAKLARMQEISDITVHLGRLLRHVMNTQNDLVTVSYELEIIESFMEIQKKHYGDKLEMDIDVPEELHAIYIPKLVLQPIVENAVVHGFSSMTDKCMIKIQGRQDNTYLYFTVEDNGAGISEKALAKILDFRQNSIHHIGLNNVNRRAKLYGGTRCGLHVESKEGKGTLVTLTLKKISAENAVVKQRFSK